MQISVVQSIQNFLDYLKFQKRYSQHTVISYKNDLDSFFTYIHHQFGDTNLPDINTMFIRSWLAELKQDGMGSKSINRKISTLKTFFKYQLRQESLAVSPMAGIISPKISKRLPQFVDKKDIATLLEHIEFPDTWDGKTQRLLIQLFYNTGMRQAELVGLKEIHIALNNSTIKVLGKGNKERVIPVSKQLMDQMQDYMSSKKNNFEVFDKVFLLVTANGKKIYPRYVY